MDQLPSIFGEPESIFDGLDVSEATRKEYAARIGLFLSFVQERGFNQHSCTAFKRYLKTRTDYSVSTKNKYLATARVFLKELHRRGLMAFDITYNVRQFRQNKKHRKEGLNDTEMRLLGVKVHCLPSTKRGTRLRALFHLLAFQGLRQIEIVRLDVEDLDLRHGIAHVRGKGSDDTEPVYLAPATVKALEEYVAVNDLMSGALFRSVGNRKTERMSTMTIRREIGALMRGLAPEKTVHGFRHFYVTNLLQTMDMRDVRKFSRHRSLEMLMVYDDEVSMASKAATAFQAFARYDFAR